MFIKNVSTDPITTDDEILLVPDFCYTRKI